MHRKLVKSCACTSMKAEWQPGELLTCVQCQIDTVTGTETKHSTSTHDRRFSAFGLSIAASLLPTGYYARHITVQQTGTANRYRTVLYLLQ